MAGLSIVIPAYNEEKRISPTLDAICSYLELSAGQEVEVIVVDDGSRDGTCEVVERHAQRHPVIRLLRNPGNRGKGYAIRHGMLDAAGDWILFSDADLSTPIEELEKLMAATKQHSAMVAFGSRALDRKLVAQHQSAFREFSGRLFNIIMRLLTGLPFRDTQCGFKLYHRSAARAVFGRQRLDGFSFDVEDLVIAKECGFACVEVPVRWSNVEGTKVGLLHGLQSFSDLLTIRYHQARGHYRPGAPRRSESTGVDSR